MFEFLSFELIVHDSAGGVVFRVVTWIITVIIGAVRVLCLRCAKTPPKTVCLARGAQMRPLKAEFRAFPLPVR